MNVMIGIIFEGGINYRADMYGNVVANNITLSGTINSSTMNNSNIVGGTLTIGSGSSVFKADANGIYLGSSTFNSAPFRVSTTGAFVATNATLVNANISGNISMTSGTMSWSNINSDPTIYTAQTTANNAVNGVTAVANGTYSGTFINGKLIYAPTLQGGRIIGNYIEGSTITGSTIIGGLFKTADTGNRIELNSGGFNSYNSSNQLHGVRIESSNFSSLAFWSDGNYRGAIESINGGLQIKPSGGNLLLNANTNTVVLNGKVDFSNAIVTGLVPVFG